MRSLAPDVPKRGPRADILGCVVGRPGVHLRGVERMTGYPLGQVLYHLDRLERMGLVVSVKGAGYRRFFVTGAFTREEKPVLAALRHDAPRRIVIRLLEAPGLAHAELREALGLAGSTVSFHLGRLVDLGVLEREPSGGRFRYRVARPDVARRALVEHASSFDDEVVARFVALAS